MNEKTKTLTVKESKHEYGLKEHNICRWIRTSKVSAEYVEGRYNIDRASLEEYLDTKKGNKVPLGDNATTVAQPQPIQPETPARPKEEKPLVDLHAGPTRRKGNGISSRPSAAKGKSELQKSRDRKALRKEARREAGKKYRKGPIHYAKDAMRQLDLAQLRDVRDWILTRMDQRMRPL